VSAAKFQIAQAPEHRGWIRFSENASPARTDGKSDAGANIGQESFRDICQRVEDNAFHLGYFA
jgi:hypothetical protein